MTGPTLVWVDLETTGLEPDAHVLEIAAVATDSDLNLIQVEPFHQVCHFDLHSNLAALPDVFVRDMHTKNGLWAEARESATPVSAAFAEFTYWLKAIVTPGNFAFAGAGVAAFDVPIIDSHSVWAKECRLYWSLDVSPARRLLEPVIGDIRTGDQTHRAMSDVCAALTQAQFIRDAVRNWRDAAINAMENAA